VVEWSKCLAEAKILHLSGVLLRLVESQEQVATNHLVSSLDRQAVLEEMLEATKPGLRSGTEGLHYLLATPFRYPPLKHGSRFGTRAEPSLFYGALETKTVLAEAAYYRFLFWHGMVMPPSGKLDTQHTLFGANYHTDQGLKLQGAPFVAYRDVLCNPLDYTQPQALGARMRAAGVEAFEFMSARDPKGSINVALFTAAALSSHSPLFQEAWLCELTGKRVSFYASHRHDVHTFPIEAFLTAGKLPQVV
jgi:hypothetical protein